MTPPPVDMPTLGEIARRVNDHHKTLYGEGDSEGVRDMAIRHDYFIQDMKEGRKWRLGIAAIVIGGVIASLVLQAMNVVKQTAIESALRARPPYQMSLPAGTVSDAASSGAPTTR